MLLPILDFPGDGALTDISLTASDDTKPYFEGLKQGRLTLQCCSNCGHFRHPIAPVCPRCSSSDFEWRDLRGIGRVFSFVTYPRAHLPQFAKLTPYSVLCVALDEGPRLFGRLRETASPIEFGMRARAVVERWSDGGCALAFTVGYQS